MSELRSVRRVLWPRDRVFGVAAVVTLQTQCSVKTCTLGLIQTGHSSRVKRELWRQSTIVWWVRFFERVDKGDSRAEREEHVFNTPVQPSTHPPYRNSCCTCLCQLPLVCCEFWRQKWHSWWGCKYGPSVWGNVTCLFQKAVAQQTISEKKPQISGCLKF